MPRENRSQGRAEARDVAAQAEAHSQTRNVSLLAPKNVRRRHHDHQPFDLVWLELIPVGLMSTIRETRLLDAYGADGCKGDQQGSGLLYITEKTR